MRYWTVYLLSRRSLGYGLNECFFPHGVGHLLGVQVHDKGGYIASPEGTAKLPPENHPALRLTRSIEDNMVLTIEPGVYFIPLLLSRWEQSAAINHQLLAELMPCGGVRIEDNVIAREGLPENLTRAAFNT